MLKTVSIIVSGKVQGVYYRQSAKEIATALDIKGWVKNMPDDTVCIIATGDPEKIEQLIKWCRQGPVRAVVTGTIIKDLPLELFDKFAIAR
jgi:acylphosphatase